MRRINVLVALLFLGICQLSFGATGGTTPTTTSLTVGPNPQSPGLTVSLVATVTPPAVTGHVLFFDGGVQIASIRTIAGRAIYDTASLSPGSHYLEAMYVGDATYAPSTSSIVIEVIGTPTTTSLTVSPNPAYLGSEVTLTATPSVPSGTGSVTFYSGAIVLGTAPIVNGVASFSTTFLPAGDQLLFARYSGDSVNGSSFSPAVPETVLARPSGGTTIGALYPLPPPALAIATADLNHDGRLDIVEVSGSTLSIFLGNGDSTFRIGQTYTLSNFGAGVGVADFNGDGNPDIAVAVTNGLFYLPGNGDGTFQTPVSVHTPAATVTSLAIADFNLDGKADIAVGLELPSNTSGEVAVLIGNGNGTFQNAIEYPTVGHSGAIAVGDLNGDGVPDLAAADATSNSVVVLNGGVGGGLLSGVTVNMGVNPTSLAIADFTGDGDADIVATNTSTNTVSTLLGNGDGTFGALIVSSSSPAPSAIVVGDFNGDGKLDVAEASTAGGVGVQFGNGDGSFATPILEGAGTAPGVIAVADLNGDGATDLAVAGSSDLTILNGTLAQFTSVALQVSPQNSLYGQTVTLTATIAPFTATGTVTFYEGTTIIGAAPVINGTATLVTSGITTGTGSITARYTGDLNDQSAVSTGIADTITAAAGSGFSPALSISSSAGPYSVAAGDFNHDGHADLVVANYNSASITVFTGNNNGTFGTPQTIATGSNPTSVVLGDFNRDSIIDIAVANNTGNSVSILLGHGDGTFAPAVNFPVTAPFYLTTGDFNNDGKLDLAIAGSSGVSILAGNGDGTFLMVATHPAGNLPYELAVGDFNGDGFPDLLVSNRGDNSVSLLLGLGNGMFGAPMNTAVAFQPAALAVGDFNFDGSLDFAVTSLNTGTVLVFYGNNSGSFSAGPTLTVPSGSGAIATIDFNGDNKLDLAVANTNSNSVSVLLNAGDGTFQSPVNYTTEAGPLSLALADFNGDARPDIAVANYSADSLSILLVSGGPVSVVQGSGQSANLNTAFATPLEVLVTSNGTPLVGASVTFTAPSSGPSGTFSTGLTATVVTGADGTATAPTFTANGILGTYTVTATASGGSATFTLTNTTAGCSFTVAPTSLAYDDTGGSTLLTITASAPTCTWTASADSTWILLSGTSGAGNGTVGVTIQANGTGVERNGNVFVAGQTVPVTSWSTTQIFTDVPPSAYYFDAVNLLYAKGVTSGCGTQLYCPTSDIDRAEMAVFLVRAVIGSDNFTYNPAPYFGDVQPTDFGFAWIQKLYELGITVGCGNNDYCPDDFVTRDQMAIFIIRARLETTTFEYPATPYFTDVPATYFAFPWIQRLKQDQITAGCSDTLYCPTSFVTRGDMAIFVMRGLFNQLFPVGTPIITSISPNTIAQGSTGNYVVTGLNTTFIPGETTLSPIPGITIGTLTVTSATSLTVQLTASSTAPLQPESVLVVTGDQMAVLPNGLIIQAP